MNAINTFCLKRKSLCKYPFTYKIHDYVVGNKNAIPTKIDFVVSPGAKSTKNNLRKAGLLHSTNKILYKFLRDICEEPPYNLCIKNLSLVRGISGSDGGEYEDASLLGYCTL